MSRQKIQSGFTAVELLITLFIAAAFLIAAYQLFNLVIKDGGETRAQSRAANIAYDYLRQYSASSTTVPCTAGSPLTNAPISIDGLSNAAITVRVTCLPASISSLSKVEASITYNQPVKTIVYATYVSSGINNLPNGLVAWWKLNGNAANNAGSPNGVINNATSTTHNGVPNTAFSFNGSNASISSNSTFGLGTTNATISCWVWTNSSPNSGLFAMVGSIGSGFGIGMGSTSQLNSDPGRKIIMTYSGVRWITTTADLSAGWHHVAMTIDAGGVPTAYVDGVSVGSYPGSAAILPENNVSYIGGTQGETRFFNGSIDDVRFYNRALPLSEIQSLYTSEAQ